MTAKTDLENAFSILDAGITAHVTALKNSHAVAAVAQAAANAAQEAANDETYVRALTTKVLSFADKLAPVDPASELATVVASVAEVPAPVLPAPAELQAAIAPLTPVAQVAAQVAAQGGLSPQPQVLANDPGATPAMIAAALAAQNAQAPAPSAFAAFEAELKKILPK